jgi:hypothetical protein
MQSSLMMLATAPDATDTPWLRRERNLERLTKVEPNKRHSTSRTKNCPRIVARWRWNSFYVSASFVYYKPP